MPRAVRTYVPTSRPKSVQLKPQPHRKTAAAPRPRNGSTTASRLATHMPGDSRPGSAGRGGSSASGSATGRTVGSLSGRTGSSFTAALLSGVPAGGDGPAVAASYPRGKPHAGGQGGSEEEAG